MSDARSSCDVSVVIPARDAAGVLPAQLAALAAQDHDQEWEVVVADNGSTDDTAALVERTARDFPVTLRVVDASRARGINVGRNDGIAAAAGTVILLCDADDEVAPGWLHALAEALESADIAGGSIELETLNSAWSVRARPMGAPFEINGVVLPIGANIGFRTAVWEHVGGFDEDFSYGAWDEHDFTYRAHCAGFSARKVPEAEVRYRLRPDRRGMMRQQWGIGRGEILFQDKHPEFLAPRSLSRDVVTLARSTGGLARRFAQRSTDRDEALGFVSYQCGRFAESARLASRCALARTA